MPHNWICVQEFVRGRPHHWNDGPVSSAFTAGCGGGNWLNTSPPCVALMHSPLDSRLYCSALLQLHCGVDLRQIIHWQLTTGVPVSTAPPPQQCRTALLSLLCTAYCTAQCTMHIVRYIWMTASLCFATLYCKLDCCKSWCHAQYMPILSRLPQFYPVIFIWPD